MSWGLSLLRKEGKNREIKELWDIRETIETMEFIKNYFQAERYASIVFMLIGLNTVVVGIYCWLVVRKPFYSGLAYPFVLIGLIELFVGVTVFLRSPKDIERVENFAVLEPHRILKEEIPRMEGVARSFVYLRYAELALLATGILMMYLMKSDLAKGLGLGLFIQASAILAADYFAERRAETYQKELRKSVEGMQKVTSSPGPSPSGATRCTHL
jgi:hypothetical protein